MKIRMFQKIILGIVLLLFINSTTNAQMCATKEAKAHLSKMAFIDTTKNRGLADNFFLWDVGETIVVKFLNGSTDLHNKVSQYAREWEKYANIKFNFTTTGKAHIRVLFGNENSNYSMMGTYANSIPQTSHTMHLDSAGLTATGSWYRTTVHEFGHALGLMHEHFSPMSGIEWNMDTLYADYEKVGWGKADVDNQVVKVAGVTYTNGTTYDAKSIMHYPIAARHTKNGYSVGWNTEMSEGDKKIISILYPKDGKRAYDVPRVTITDYTNTQIKHDAINNGIRIYPSFEVNVAGSKGTVYFVAMIFDKNGNVIQTKNDSYSLSGILSTYKGFTLEPETVLGANKNSPTDFELFLPYDQIPVGANTNEIKVVFSTWVSTKDEFKNVFSSTPVAFALNR